MKHLITTFIFCLGLMSMGCESHHATNSDEHSAVNHSMVAGGLAKGHSHDHTSISRHNEHEGCGKKVSNKRLLYHEMGHVKWNKLDSYQQQVWKEIWDLVIEGGVQPNEPYTDDGECKNYFEFNPCEGFCVAYSILKTNGTLDPSIQNFFDNL